MEDSTTFCIDALAELFYRNLLETEDFGENLRFAGRLVPLIMQRAFVKNLERFDDKLRAEVPRSWDLCDRRKRTIITLHGEISYHRRIYIDEYGHRRYPLDEVLGIAAYQKIEPAAFEWIIRCAANISFKKTAEAFEKASGVSITRQTVMRCVHKEGELLAKSDVRNDAKPVSTPVLFMEFDGLHVSLQSETKSAPRPRRTYKEQYLRKSMELKVGVMYAGKEAHRRLRPIHWASGGLGEDFFKEGMTLASTFFEMDRVDYIKAASDAATWCKNHGLDVQVKDGTAIISSLDVYHINQRVYRAFSSEDDRSYYLNLLYKKDYRTFFFTLAERMEREPEDQRYERRYELYCYIEDNLDWLDAPSLSRLMRERLLSELPSVFGGRSFYDHLYTLLASRRYKRFLRDLKKVVDTCEESLYYDYSCFLDDATEAIKFIKLYGRMSLGTMEGTNAKVYAARLKVWGCSWSRRGAIAMARIRAAIASGMDLVAPPYRGWFSQEERKRREKPLGPTAKEVPATTGEGWEPPQAKVAYTAHLPAKYYRMLNFS
ncbi:MAG: UPF0236 family protein [Coriobacteriia bacterium]|nr:UPF0236 family protein [Coriobacteriia bacterium]